MISCRIVHLDTGHRPGSEYRMWRLSSSLAAREILRLARENMRLRNTSEVLETRRALSKSPIRQIPLGQVK
jgi:hypothetical protein